MSDSRTVLAPYLDRLTASPDQVARDLDAYVALLRKWNAVQNLVSRETLNEVWTRHIGDSLQILRFLVPKDHIFVDLGSGGGLPALPLAIASRGLERRFELFEPVTKKAGFLKTVARELSLPVTVHAERAGPFDSRETADVITSRALAALPHLLGYALPFTGDSSRLLLHKGREYRAELDEAAALFDFDVVVHPSESGAGGVVLEIAYLRAKSIA